MQSQLDQLFEYVPNTKLQIIKSLADVTLAVDTISSVGWIFFHKQNKSVNVLDNEITDMALSLLNELETEFIQTKRLQALVLYSLKRNNFIAGADVNMIYQIRDPKEATQIAWRGHMFLLRVEKLPIPTIAAIHGSCLGGGLEVALACSYRIASNHPSTELGLPEVKLGLIPGCGGTVRLPRLIGLQNAMELILPGAQIKTNKAKQLGIIDELVSIREEDIEDDSKVTQTFFSKVYQYVLENRSPQMNHNNLEKFERYNSNLSWKNYMLEQNFLGRYFIQRMTKSGLDKFTKGHYPAPYEILNAILKEYTMPLEEACKNEANVFGQLAVTQEAKNLMGLFFMIEDVKRMENYCDMSQLPSNLKKVGVVGAGVMGSGIAQYLTYKKYKTYMKDIDEHVVRQGMKKVTEMFQNLADKKRITEEQKKAFLSQITAGTTYGGLQDATVIIEAAVETLSVKQRIIKDIEDINPNAIIASNTSSLPIHDIAANAQHKENIIGMHFFHPVHLMPLVEIIKTPETSPKAIAAVYKIALSLGKFPILVNDGPGFLTTRLFGRYVLEAANLALQGVPVIEIDKQLRDFGMPMGPFEVLDESGLDVGVHVLPILAPVFGVDTKNFIAAQFLQELVSAGFIGKKSSKGFYLYDSNGKRRGLNTEAEKLFDKYHPQSKGSNSSISGHTIVDCCVLGLINEACKCLEEGIASNPSTVDLGMIMGFGFPPFRGGLLHYADTLTLPKVQNRLKELNEQMPKPNGFSPCELIQKMARNRDLFFPDHPRMRTNVSKL